MQETRNQQPLYQLQKLEQKTIQPFSKKFSGYATNIEFEGENVMKILDNSSKPNQRVVSRKSMKKTYIRMQFSSENDYQRQKILLQSLNSSGNFQEVSELEMAKIQGALGDDLEVFKYQNGRFPNISGFSDEQRVLELECGQISLEALRRVRDKNGVVCQDSEIQFLMKSLCKSVVEMYNNGIFHGDIQPGNIYLRKNLLNFYEPVIADFTEASFDYQVLHGFDPVYGNYMNEEILFLETKEERLQQEFYMVGRTIQRLLLCQNSKYEQTLFSNQTNVGIKKSVEYLKNQKHNLSQKTIECLEILLSKGNLQDLHKKFKRFKKSQMIEDQDKLIFQQFEAMCINHPPILKKASVKRKISQKLHDLSISTAESETEEEKQEIEVKKEISLKQEIQNKKQEIKCEQVVQLMIKKQQIEKEKQRVVQESQVGKELVDVEVVVREGHNINDISDWDMLSQNSHSDSEFEEI